MKKRIQEFWDDHKWDVIPLAAIGTMFGIAAMASIKRDRADHEVVMVKQLVREDGTTVGMDVVFRNGNVKPFRLTA